ETGAPLAVTDRLLLCFVSALILFSFGCASPTDVNPPAAKPHTGYVDLFADPADDLSWHVEAFNPEKNRFEVAHSDVKYLEGDVLRLAFKPGRNRLRVSFLNCVGQPAECAVNILDGRITPVRVTVTETGTTQVHTRDETRGGTIYGRYGRRTKFTL